MEKLEKEEKLEKKSKEKVKRKKININSETMDKIKKFVFSATIIIVLFLLAAAETPKTLQNDTYYNIKVGEWIYNNGISNLTEDVHSWHDLPYTFPHWLYDLGIFLIYNSFGHEGIYVSTMIIYGLLGSIIYLIAKNKSNNRVVSAVISIFAVLMLDPYMAARAQSVTFVLFALTVFFIEKYLDTHKKRYLIPLIIIPILITNLHCAVFPFYFVLFLPYVAEYLLAVVVDWDLDRKFLVIVHKILLKICKKNKEEKIKARLDKINENTIERKRKRGILRENPYKIKIKKDHATLLLIVVIIVAAFTGFLNPAGNGAYTYLVKTYQGNTTQSINEHLPVTLIESNEFLIAIVVALALLIFTDTKIKLADLFMAAGLTYLALKSRRQISMFIIFCLPIMGKLISDMFKKYDRDKLTNFIFKFCTDIFGVVIVLSLASIVMIRRIEPKINDDYISSASYPVEAAEWIKENLDLTTLKLYNEYNYGSYLLLQDIPVFIDSRCDLYTPEFNSDFDSDVAGKDIFSDAINIVNLSIGYEDKFEEYGVNHVILYADAKLAVSLNTDSNYKNIYDDGRFVIFERLNAND